MQQLNFIILKDLENFTVALFSWLVGYDEREILEMESPLLPLIHNTNPGKGHFQGAKAKIFFDIRHFSWNFFTLSSSFARCEWTLVTCDTTDFVRGDFVYFFITFY